jgi:protein-disulfide isomerase
MCIAVYAICLLLLYFNWLLRRRFRLSPFKSDLIEDIRFLWSARRISLPIIGAVIVMGATVRFYLPHYWERRIPAISQAVRTGVTPDGHPWIGAEQPVLEIVEFTDYLCFQCRKMHHYLRELVERHPDKIRLVHRNYPMDHEVNFIFREPFHIGSGKLALLSLYAAEVGKFWEMNDLLYRISRNGNSISLGQISAELEIDVRQLAAALNDPILKRRLEIDVRYGLKLRILGTPTYMINAQIFEGFIPPEIIFPATTENSSLNSGTGSRTVSHSDT